MFFRIFLSYTGETTKDATFEKSTRVNEEVISQIWEAI